MIYGFATNDAGYKVKKARVYYEGGVKKREQLWACPFYVKWMQMLQRCFCKEYKERKPSYRGVSCCSEWLLFSNFKKWMEQHDYLGKELDKDLLICGNKIYSPDSCCFISRKINSFMTLAESRRGDFPIGVTLHKRDAVFHANISNGGSDKKRYLGSFLDPMSAHKAWQLAKLDKCLSLIREEVDVVVIRGLKRVADKLNKDIENDYETKHL